MKSCRILSVFAMSGLLIAAAAQLLSAQSAPGQAKKRLPPTRIGWEVMQAKQLHKRLPNYPVPARQQKVTGEVRLDILVARDGKVEEVKVLSGDTLLAAPVAGEIKKWQFQPTLLSGHPIKVVSEIDLEFRLHKGKSKVTCTNDRPPRLP